MNGDGRVELPYLGHCGEDGNDIKVKGGDEGPPSADGEVEDGSDDEESMDCYEALVLMKSRVLLVENDDSTRYVVDALLRNCGYEGIALLRKIMNHKTRKNIPGIMMSTHDCGALVGVQVFVKGCNRLPCEAYKKE